MLTTLISAILALLVLSIIGFWYGILVIQTLEQVIIPSKWQFSQNIGWYGLFLMAAGIYATLAFCLMHFIVALFV